MIVKPCDQVLDYFVYLGRVNKAMGDVEKFQNGYQYWVRRET